MGKFLGVSSIELESLVSLLYRISKESGYSFPADYCSELKMSTNDFMKNKFSIESIQKVSELTNLTFTEVFDMTRLFYVKKFGSDIGR